MALALQREAIADIAQESAYSEGQATD